MLKDLDQRSPETGQATVPSVITKKTSTFKIVTLCVIVLLSLNALGFYIWNLQERLEKSELSQLKSDSPQVDESKLAIAPVVENAVAEKPSTQEEQNIGIAKQVISEPLQNLVNKAEKQGVQHTTEVKTNLIESESKSSPRKVKTEPQVIPKPSNGTINNSQRSVPKTEIDMPLPKIAKNNSSMSISRRQLSSEELIEQKLARAEKLVNLNEIFKAEQFFEDILIIDPNHKQARKKLAALWFGRRAYQQAVNLLSQGIALDQQDSELRMLKARIYIKQGKHEDAYNTLKPLATVENEEYQVMLANIAQQIEQFPSAIMSYQVLIKMQPYSGRWHLGLAIVYDKTSQFALAINQYALALTKTDLSASSAKFAQQRMQALGE